MAGWHKFRHVIATKTAKPSFLTCSVLVLALSLTPLHAVRAENFFDLISDTLKKHDRVKSLKSELTAAEERSVEAVGDWFPTLNQTANYGLEDQDKPADTDTTTTFYEYDLKLTQLLWDFGATNATVEKARLALAQAQTSYESGVQGLIKEAATAYANLVRAHEVLRFAEQSKENILTQTGLEQAKVDAGGGYSTDVLQARSQLAGAESRLLSAQGSLNAAENRFRTVFGFVPENLDQLEALAVDTQSLPTTVDDAITLAQDRNLALHQATLAEATTLQSLKNTQGTTFYPKVQAIVERKWKRNVSGTLGHKVENIGKIEMSMPFNLGMVAVNTLRAAQSDVAVQTHTVAEKRRTIEETVRNAWQAYKTAQATAAALGEQAVITGAFLDLARKERAIGRRSLIDVLAGETSLINAQSDALSARTDILLKALDLLEVTAQLEPTIFNAMPALPSTPLKP